ncbi:MAG TPA: rRNA adenine N-6-methyltransferase family protein [archaeon]|nr:rRNA adenine N-6-methyltransferase family protein [archaeon]
MNIKQLLAIAKIVPKQEMDQYFLQSDDILNEEVSLATLSSKDTVLEVGAGIGNLTILLSKKAKVLAIEKDYSFTHILKGINNCNAVFGDALEFLESLRQKPDKLKHAPVTFNKIVSNIPYSISQPLLLEFFRHKWGIAVLIVQKEFAEKLISKERLGMIMSEMAEIKIVRDVPANAFYPEAVPSAIVLIKQKKLLDDKFWDFLCSLKPNKDVSNQVKKCPKTLEKKKVHQLTLKELRQLYVIKS